jgi:hypothetical protein
VIDLSVKYKDAILRVLAEAQQPMDVEKIRVACKIGNWQTALKHCLELLYDHKICATKSSKSWIFWTKARKRR